MLTFVKRLWAREPVLIGALPAVLGLLVAAGVLSSDETARISGVVAAVVALLGALLGRAQVIPAPGPADTASPTANPAPVIDDTQLPPLQIVAAAPQTPDQPAAGTQPGAQ